jgi:class 3 adenylate cyclase
LTDAPAGAYVGTVRPETRYARSGEVSIAYQVVGEGDLDLVLVFPFVSHLDLNWESPFQAAFIERLATFSRVILFDRRGVGLSDPVDDLPSLEVRMDDVRAVMDAAGSERAALLGMSEGAPMTLLFAATYPERVSSLVLWGAMARSVADHDYPWAASEEAMREAHRELVAPYWGQGATVEIFAPSMAKNPRARELMARLERQAASPRRSKQLYEMFLDIDVRDFLSAVHVPTLVMHRTGDLAVNVRAGRWLAEQIDSARFLELDGIDHSPWVGDADTVLDEIEEFLTGAPPAQSPDRVLATVLFTDIVTSTERAAEIGDARWRTLLENHQGIVRRQLEQFGGREVKTTGDGFLATFDGPARALRCANSIVARVDDELGLKLRAGLHAGEVEVMGDDVGGIAVHVAARVCARAEPSTVLLSRTVKDLVSGSGIEFDPRGQHRLKGVPDEWELFSLRVA